MSVTDAPMALLDRIRGRVEPVVPDDPMLRRFGLLGTDLEPDPLFRRRLRGEVLNRHVALREGHRLPAPRRAMTPIGRGVLVASLGLAISVGTAGAASQESLPGDLLYPMKLQIEALRMQVAPNELQAYLAADALDERLSELERLAEAGRWGPIDQAAASVAAAELRVQQLGGAGAEVEQRLARHVEVLDALLLTAPDPAEAGLRRARDASAKVADGSSPGGPGGERGGSDDAPGQGGIPGQGQGEPGAQPSAHPTRQPAPSQATSRSS